MGKLSDIDRQILLAIWASRNGLDAISQLAPVQQQLLSEPEYQASESQILAEKMKMSAADLNRAFFQLEASGLLETIDVEEIADSYVTIDRTLLEESINDSFDLDLNMDEANFFDTDVLNTTPFETYRLSHSGFREIANDLKKFHELAHEEPLKSTFAAFETSNPLSAINLGDGSNDKMGDDRENQAINLDQGLAATALERAIEALEVIRQSNTLSEDEKGTLVDHILLGIELLKKPQVYISAISWLLAKPLYDAYSSALEEASKPHIQSAIEAVLTLIETGS